MNKFIFVMCGAVGLALGGVQPAVANQCPEHSSIINSCVLTWECLSDDESVPSRVEPKGTACTTKSGASGTCNGSRFSPLCVSKTAQSSCQGTPPTGTCTVSTCGADGQWQSETTAGAACTTDGRRGTCNTDGKCVKNQLSCRPRNVRCSVLCGPVGDVTKQEYESCLKNCSALPVCSAGAKPVQKPRNKAGADQTAQSRATEPPSFAPAH